MMPALLLDTSMRARHLRWLRADSADVCVAAPVACAITTQNPTIPTPTTRTARSRFKSRSFKPGKTRLAATSSPLPRA